jgi:thioredoxin 1
VSVITVTARTFESEVLAADQPVIVDFWAPWCGPCHAVAPALDRIAEERAGELKVAKVNVEAEIELALRYRITSIPAIMRFEGGKPVGGVVGARSKSELERALGLPETTADAAGENGHSRRLLPRFRARH